MREYGSEFPITGIPDNYYRSLIARFKDYRFLQTGRQGLRLIAKELSSGNSMAILPGYCCKTMVSPFEEEGWKVSFYPILPNMDGDVEVINSLIEKAPDNSVLLLMNYFGLSNVSGVIKNLKNRDKVKIVYDVTHCIFDFSNVYNEDVDFYVASIRKWVGLYSGALVCSKSDIKSDVASNEDSDFVKLRKRAMVDNLLYQTTGDINEKLVFKNTLKEAATQIDSIPRLIDGDSFKMLEGLDCNHLLWKRQFNIRHLFSLIKGNKKISFIHDMEEKITCGYCSFMLPILLEKRDYYQKQLSDNGLYAQVLWPLLDEARLSSPVAASMEAKMLAIPIDQRFSFNDIEDIGRIINTFIS